MKLAITSLTLSSSLLLLLQLTLLPSAYSAEQQALLALQNHPSLEGELRTNTIPIVASTTTTATNKNNNKNLRRFVQERPSCPNQASCHDFGNGWLGYSIRKTDETGYCREICAAGGSLTFYLEQDGFACGNCEQPKCPEQAEPCHDFGNGYLGYSVYEMQQDNAGTGATCRQVCAAGNSLAVKLANGQYTCGTCPAYNCPGQESCRDFGNGLLGYSVYKVAAETGVCETFCAAGTFLENYRNQGYTCGECAMVELPDNEQRICTEQDLCGQENGWVGAYSLYKFDETENICTQACASGYHITDRLDEGFQCGTCPGYDEIDNPVELPSCPDQEPCAENNGLRSFSLFKVNQDGVTCTQACASGYYVTNLQDQGFTCGYCPSP